MIIRNIVTPHGALATFHKVESIRVDPPYESANIEVYSYASEDAFLAGTGAMYRTPLTVPLASGGAALIDGIEARLVAAVDSPFTGGTIVADRSASLDTAKVRKVATLSAQCEAGILAGFDSEALGANHHYPARVIDQMNLVASVTDSLIPGLPEDWTTKFWCADPAGKWELRPHTAEQIQRVGREGKQAITAHITKNEDLSQLVMSLQTDTLEALNAITW